MKSPQFFLFATLLPILVFVFSAASRAQTVLPWERNTQNQDSNKSSDGRSYNEPGETYDPSRHDPSKRGTSGQQGGYSQQGTNRPNSRYDGGTGGGYDRGYDALRNNGRAGQGTQDRRPYANQPYGSTENNKSTDAQRPYDRPPTNQQRNYPSGDSRAYNDQDRYGQGRSQQGYPQANYPSQGYQPPTLQGPGQAYAPPPSGRRNFDPYAAPRQQRPLSPAESDTYSDDEILNAGHKFFGQVTKAMAKVIAHVFKKSGRPNGYILGEEGGGALIAGLRYGEGTIYTKSGIRRRIYWQGPSIGYDFGVEGAKTMILVYNLRNIDKMYGRFAGVDGSAYLVGGIGVTFQKRGRVVLAPIRAGLGLRLGANVGYLKYTRRPTWNPF